MEPEITNTERPLPKSVQKRLTSWYNTFWLYAIGQMTFGTLGVVAATMSAADLGGFSKACGITSAFCISILAFMKPEERYRRSVTAWRILDRKAQLYKNNQIEIRELLDGMADAEDAIAQLESNERQRRPTNPTNPSNML